MMNFSFSNTTPVPGNLTTTEGIDEDCCRGFLLPSAICIVIMFLIIVICSSVGNLLVMWIIVRNRRMRTVTNYFLFNLSAADLLTVFQILPNVYYGLKNDWIFGLAYCKFSQFFTAFNIAISVFTFIGITSDRYTAIMFPLRPRSKPRTVICAILVIWLISFAIGSPGLIVATVVPQTDDQQPQNWTSLQNGSSATGTDVHIANDCILAWSEEWSEAYDYTLFILMYVLPLIILAATYIPISIRLWFHKGLGEVTRAQAESVRSKRKAVKMLCAVMLIFAICWLPYQLFFVMLQISPSLRRSHHVPFVFICCYWLAMSNSMYNPIIYIVMNKKFRKGFYTAFSCLPYCRAHKAKWKRSVAMKSTVVA